MARLRDKIEPTSQSEQIQDLATGRSALAIAGVARRAALREIDPDDFTQEVKTKILMELAKGFVPDGWLGYVRLTCRRILRNMLRKLRRDRQRMRGDIGLQEDPAFDPSEDDYLDYEERCNQTDRGGMTGVEVIVDLRTGRSDADTFELIAEKEFSDSRLALLTPRQRDVVEAVMRGQKPAETLGISRQMANRHLRLAVARLCGP